MELFLAESVNIDNIEQYCLRKTVGAIFRSLTSSSA